MASKQLFKLPNVCEGIIAIPSGFSIIWGSGTPEGNIAAPIGSLYCRISDGGADTALYVKATGGRTTKTLWRAISSQVYAGVFVAGAQATQLIAAAGPLVRTAGKSFYPVSSSPAAGGAVTGGTVPAGTTAGEIIIIQGVPASGTDTVRFDDAGTLKLGGNRVMSTNAILGLIWDGTNWDEMFYVANG